MKIEIAASDILPLRSLVAESHQRIKDYPVVKDEDNDKAYHATKAYCLDDMRRLRKLHRRLTLACRKLYGHDCHPETLTENDDAN